MQQLNDYLPKSESPRDLSPCTTTSRPQTFSDQEKDVTAYFFLRLRNIYPSKYEHYWPDLESEQLAKREYAKTIGKYDRERIHEAFEKVKLEKEKLNDDFNWPNIDAIVGLLKCHISPDGKNSAAYLEYKPNPVLQDQSKEALRKAAGRRELDKMKSMLC